METYHANAKTCRMTNSNVSANIFHCVTDISVNKKMKNKTVLSDSDLV